MFERVPGVLLPNLERILIVANIVGSLVAGWYGQHAWLPLSAAVFALHLVAEDRALRRRIGVGHWPSAGFAKFSFGTNLYIALKNTLLGALLFALAGAVASALPF